MKMLTAAGYALLLVMLAFIALNWALGCNSWDPEQRSPGEQCVTPSELLRRIV